MESYLGAFKKYAVFSGRATRKEFWTFFLFNFLIAAFLTLVDLRAGLLTGHGGITLDGIYGLVVMVPNLALSVRRLHDTGRSGWWLLLTFIPIVGLLLIAYWAEDSQSYANQYGPNPMADRYAPIGNLAPSIPAGWWTDPTGRHERRYRDAASWTDHVADAGVRSQDPFEASAE